MTPQVDRIASLDALRGLGVLGILAVNAAVFAQPFALQFDPAVLGPMDADSTTVWGLVHVAFERKFVTLFSILFGASILLVGGEPGDPVRTTLLHRRLAWLLVFGVIHGALIWYGDILLCYAVTGFLAAGCRGWSARRLLVVGGLATVVMGGFEAADHWARALGTPVESDFPFTGPDSARAEIVAFSGDFLASLRANVERWLVLAGQTLFFVPSTLGLMLLGMGLFKTGVLGAQRSVGFYLGLVAAGVVAMALLAGAVNREIAGGFSDPVDTAWRDSINSVLAPVMTLGYVGLVCLAMRTPARRLLRPLAATGQMAFTNYLTQSLIMTALFYGGRGPGLFGSLTLAEVAPYVAGVWIAQMIWSPLWLMAFRYGPFEWIWRSLTLGRAAPFWRLAGEP